MNYPPSGTQFTAEYKEISFWICTCIKLNKVWTFYISAEMLMNERNEAQIWTRLQQCLKCVCFLWLSQIDAQKALFSCYPRAFLDKYMHFYLRIKFVIYCHLWSLPYMTTSVIVVVLCCLVVTFCVYRVSNFKVTSWFYRVWWYSTTDILNPQKRIVLCWHRELITG